MGRLHVMVLCLLVAAVAATASPDCTVACLGVATAAADTPCTYTTNASTRATTCLYMPAAQCATLLHGTLCVVRHNHTAGLLGEKTTTTLNTTTRIVAPVSTSEPPPPIATPDTTSSSSSTIVALGAAAGMLVVIIVVIVLWYRCKVAQKQQAHQSSAFSLVGSTRRPYQPTLHDTLRSPTPEVWARKYSLFASGLSKVPKSSNASYLDTVTSSSVDPWVFKEHDLSSSNCSDMALSQSVVMMRDTATFTRDDDFFDLTGVYAPPETTSVPRL
ncbi:hypothetical protein SDRG_11372 [Saprolegnia diclina VS20]|uniref:Membrane-associated protein n=1 Tax=Saprolegnia diclina (strain VS20) TaxID=1156394 RepID=T0Q8E4_SAPDV|nr:hypothetical protein SDRG_11372 [Saprolegnia diclina VS20]EQC30891.1 hypothetical protein SDRG_11372 [Saprolegnia diclina VS20]|eukprot:XP_008615629.1 hypothetical protein SDRG_11372 [Saprolegnia diclina VS20]